MNSQDDSFTRIVTCACGTRNKVDIDAQSFYCTGCQVAKTMGADDGPVPALDNPEWGNYHSLGGKNGRNL